MPATDQSVSLQLRLDVPADASISVNTLTVKAEGQGNNVSLPITVNLAKELPAKLTLSPQLPALRGTPKSSFDYTVSVKNDSGRNLTVSLAATAPRNFETSFTESYGTQELSSVPIDAGASKDVKLKVRPPSSVDAGSFPIEMTATSGDTTAKTQLTLEVVGQPRLTIAGSDGLVSARAEAGKQGTVPVVISNDGTAAADNIVLVHDAAKGEVRRRFTILPLVRPVQNSGPGAPPGPGGLGTDQVIGPGAEPAILRFSADGRELLVGGRGDVRAFRIDTGKPSHIHMLGTGEQCLAISSGLAIRAIVFRAKLRPSFSAPPAASRTVRVMRVSTEPTISAFTRMKSTA